MGPFLSNQLNESFNKSMNRMCKSSCLPGFLTGQIAHVLHDGLEGQTGLLVEFILDLDLLEQRELDGFPGVFPQLLLVLLAHRRQRGQSAHDGALFDGRSKVVRRVTLQRVELWLRRVLAGGAGRGVAVRERDPIYQVHGEECEEIGAGLGQTGQQVHTVRGAGKVAHLTRPFTPAVALARETSKKERPIQP